jgi:lipoate-protein ligase A
MKKHPTSNIQHPTPKLANDGRALDAERSMLDVGCFPIPQNWLVLNSGAGGAAFNMALDEALLEAMPRLQKPVLRFYGWTEPAATFGYFQKISEVERATHLRPLIRRPTGGGIVPHEADWTYSVVFPPGHEWHSLKAEESYRRIHDWLRLAFAELKIETELAPCCRKTESGKPKAKIPSACFIGYEKSDLLWRGKKIAGAAQRRNKLGLLIQGSVQPPPISLARTDWENAMGEVARTPFHVAWSKFTPDAGLAARADELTRQKYSQNGYNQKQWREPK